MDKVLQEWEGYVRYLEDDGAWASLIDITAGHDYESEEAWIPKDNFGLIWDDLFVGTIFSFKVYYGKVDFSIIGQRIMCPCCSGDCRNGENSDGLSSSKIGRKENYHGA